MESPLTAISTSGFILVTGGANGFGLAVAKEAIRKKVCDLVIIIDIDVERLQLAKVELRSLSYTQKVLTFATDLSVNNSGENIMKFLTARKIDLKDLRYLFLNHAIGFSSEILVAPIAAIRRISNNNVFSYIRIIKTIVNYMLENDHVEVESDTESITSLEPEASAQPSDETGEKQFKLLPTRRTGCRIICSGSIAGSLNLTGAYGLSKQAVTNVAELVHYELEARRVISPSMHVINMGFCQTTLCSNSMKVMELQAISPEEKELLGELRINAEDFDRFLLNTTPTATVAGEVWRQLLEPDFDKFYITTHRKANDSAAKNRCDHLISGKLSAGPTFDQALFVDEVEE